MTRLYVGIFVFFVSAFVLVHGAFGQTTEFTYQGQLQASAAPANGNFDFEFLLYDGGGSQIGSALSRSGVVVASGIFSVNLDFGTSFPSATRFLEIRVRQAGGGAFTTLSPRQPVTSSPYSIKSLTADTAANAVNAATANTAVNATTAVTSTNFTGNLSGDVTGTQSATTVARLQGRTVSAAAPLNDQVLKFNTAANQWQPAADNTGAGGGVTTVTASGPLASSGGAAPNISLGQVPTANIADAAVTDAKIVTVSGAKVTGAVSNATNATTAANATTAVNFSGTLAGEVTGTQSATAIVAGAVTTAKLADAAVTSPKIANGQVVKSVNSLTDNVTLAAGSNITITPAGNTLTIASTGGGNPVLNQTTQQANANFNISGNGTAGGTLSAATVNAATQFNIGGNRFASRPGTSNTFVGDSAGNSSGQGYENSIFGAFAGQNTLLSGWQNSFFGFSAGHDNTTGQTNSFFGTRAGYSNLGGQNNSFFGNAAGFFNTQGIENSFFGTAAGQRGTTGVRNTFVGAFAGFESEGYDNSFFGSRSGRDSDGSENVFFGNETGATDRTGTNNTLIGFNADLGSISLTNATALGHRARVDQSNSLILGSILGVNNATASTNVGIGTTTPAATLHVNGTSIVTNSGNREVSIGVPNGESGIGIKGTSNRADLRFDASALRLVAGVGTGPPPATSGISVTTAGNVGIGQTTPLAKLDVAGIIKVDSLAGGGSESLCRNPFFNTIATCSSSQRYKENIKPFYLGMDAVKRLRPVTFSWKESHTADLGLVAEEVNAVEPLLNNYNQKGEIEGVKYEQLTVVLINAMKEQQGQIEEQRKLIDQQKAENETLKARILAIEKALGKRP